jgi:hypothetical protein
MEFGVVTIASGPRRYIDMAIALRRSIRVHNPGAPVTLVTDAAAAADPAVRSAFDAVKAFADATVHPLLQKLCVDLYADHEHTLYIDADCLVFGDLGVVVERLRGAGSFSPVAYGEPVTRETTHHPETPDPRIALEALGIERYPVVHSGVFYFDRSETARRVFEESRRILGLRERLGFRRFGSAPIADEPLMGMAMAHAGLEGFRHDDAGPGERLISTVEGETPGLATLNVLAGPGWFTWRGRVRVSPIILHYILDAKNHYHYAREMERLSRPGRARGLALHLGALRRWLPLKAAHYARRLAERTRRLRAAFAPGMAPARPAA